jgi:septum formation protein
MTELILASGSAHRRALLERLGLPFSCVPADLDERQLPGEPPAEMAMRLARAKAAAVARPGRLIIGSDQVAVTGTGVAGKPGGFEAAAAQLSAVSGHCVVFLTAVVVVQPQANYRAEHLDETRVTFRKLSAAEIHAYLRAEEPYDCAGAFKAEGLGISLFEKIESTDPTALIGLPLIWLTQALIAAGMNPLLRSAPSQSV